MVYVILWVSAFLSNRKQHVVINGVKSNWVKGLQWNSTRVWSRSFVGNYSRVRKRGYCGLLSKISHYRTLLKVMRYLTYTV